MSEEERPQLNGEVEQNSDSESSSRWEEQSEAPLKPEETLPEPDVKSGIFGFISDARTMRKRRKKRKKLIGKGYVQWFLVNDAWPEPKFVKPKHAKGGQLQYRHDGGEYLFPRSAMLANQQQGMWTVVHRKGEAEPINIRDPDELAIKSDELREYLDAGLSSSPPGLLDNLDMDITPEKAMMALIGLIVVWALMSGGGPL